MKLNELKDFGRTITVEFQCRRCKTTATKPLADSLPVDSFTIWMRTWSVVDER